MKMTRLIHGMYVSSKIELENELDRSRMIDERWILGYGEHLEREYGVNNEVWWRVRLVVSNKCW